MGQMEADQVPGAQQEAKPSEFAATQPFDDDARWPESIDGQCSEHAALFAASQPAPLTIV
jgi:hypothetical protein